MLGAKNCEPLHELCGGDKCLWRGREFDWGARCAQNRVSDQANLGHGDAIRRHILNLVR
jgi:hypothetical protein